MSKVASVDYEAYFTKIWGKPTSAFNKSLMWKQGLPLWGQATCFSVIVEKKSDGQELVLTMPVITSSALSTSAEKIHTRIHATNDAILVRVNNLGDGIILLYVIQLYLKGHLTLHNAQNSLKTRILTARNNPRFLKSCYFELCKLQEKEQLTDTPDDPLSNRALSRGVSGADIRFLKDTVDLVPQHGSLVQDITRTYGTVAQRRHYPKYTDLITKGWTSLPPELAYEPTDYSNN